MLRWNNDYNHGAHPAILEAFTKYNEESYGGYGIDDWCQKATREIQKSLGIKSPDEVDIHYLVGGTQVNFVVIAAALRPYQSVISADTGHINAHETGAVENTGHKIQTVPNYNGKLSPEDVRKVAQEFRVSDIQEHITMPGMVFVSFPTELGTVYSLKELEEIRAICDEYGMYLHIDGARLGYGLGAEGCDVTLQDIARLADVFYIGGTKCGAMFGEAVVIRNNDIKKCFRSHMKQNGAMLAKGWTIGMQFYTLFNNGLYLEITGNAVKMAMEIKSAFRQKNIPLFCDSPTNQQFVILTNEQMERISKKHIYEYQCPVDGDRHCVRFCTSWSTGRDDVLELVQDILAL